MEAIYVLKDYYVCYVLRDDCYEAVPVERGDTNDQFVEIKLGLKPGEKVLLREPRDTERVKELPPSSPDIHPVTITVTQSQPAPGPDAQGSQGAGEGDNAHQLGGEMTGPNGPGNTEGQNNRGERTGRGQWQERGRNREQNGGATAPDNQTAPDASGTTPDNAEGQRPRGQRPPMTEEQQQRQAEIWSKLAPEEQQKFIQKMRQMTPEEGQALQEATKGKSADEVVKYLRENILK